MNGFKCLFLFLSLGQSLNYSIIIQYYYFWYIIYCCVTPLNPFDFTTLNHGLETYESGLVRLETEDSIHESFRDGDSSPESWKLRHKGLSTINSSSIILQQTSMIVQTFYCVVILQTVLNSNIELMPLLISRIVLMKPRRRVKNCWQLLRNFRNYLKKQMKVH